MPPEGSSANAVDRFDQLGEQPMSNQESDARQAVASALGGLPIRGPGLAIMEQRLQQVEGDPSLLMRNQFMLEEMRFIRQSGGPLRESRPW